MYDKEGNFIGTADEEIIRKALERKKAKNEAAVAA